VVKVLLDGKADVSTQNKHGATTLHLATQNAHVDLVKVLLDAKAEVAMRDNHSITALHWVSKKWGGEYAARLQIQGDDAE